MAAIAGAVGTAVAAIGGGVAAMNAADDADDDY